MTESEINKEAAKFFPPQRYPFGLAFSQDDVVAFAKHCVDKSQQWRPIDDDAKSGKPVFVLEKGVPLKACFIKKFAMEASDTYDGAADYSEELDEYYWPEGWYEWNQHEDTHWALDSEPTHYMNIPPAPEAA